jgi:hypothetical protein
MLFSTPIRIWFYKIHPKITPIISQTMRQRTPSKIIPIYGQKIANVPCLIRGKEEPDAQRRPVGADLEAGWGNRMNRAQDIDMPRCVCGGVGPIINAEGIDQNSDLERTERA